MQRQNLTPSTIKKREQLNLFIQSKLAMESAIQGVVAFGSLASGYARPDSDIDAVIFLDPYDEFIAPAEAIWRPRDDSFHSIFSNEPGIKEEGIEFDFIRLDMQKWSEPEFEWPEGYKAELCTGWIAFDPNGLISALIAQKTIFDDQTRMERLDEAITWLDQHLGEDTPRKKWQTLGPTIAHDRLEAAYFYLVQGLFTYNRRWRPWRNREMSTLLQLPWLPAQFNERAIFAANAPSLDYQGYSERAQTLQDIFQEFLTRLVSDGDYGDDPIGEAFIRAHEEPGRAWNLEEWNRKHRQRSG